MKKIKCAIIGYGYWGINIAKSLDKWGLFEIETIFDEDISRIKEAQKLYQFKIYSSYEEILKNDAIEAIFIITPPQTHYQLAKKAIMAEKHLFVEKPLTTNLKEAYELYELASQRNLKIHCDHVFLYSPAVGYLKSNIESFGELVYIHSRRINLGLFQSNVDVIWDLAIHDLSIIDALVGLEIKKVSTFSKKYQSYPNDALANISIELESGIIATISVSWLSPIKVREMIIGGSKKSAVYDDVQRDKIRIYDAGVVIKDEFDKDTLFAKMVEYRLGQEEVPNLPSYMSLDASIETFYHMILQNGPSNRDHVLRVIEALEIISKA
ncbi:Gfo/Idh/MocA family protein [Helicobacter kayseriensis]|uniref:Gfo/Idh/MocA family protein n=1 Tax=Helicobacter kayseriensis TaxID=2905877 RepID=UPI001E4C0BE6|nr:Gfo/Idh/MocA family oxidoreductase [Helicobacter kayseriensis]MCE3047645.1 Gfo/Idh/MocA family oxidoreductase [Helicobacter kayseriensis]MCE3049003.1 Gfo/Idh/MocA family oxidoreductase [Helicobacter kayseriensis]